MQCYLQNPVLSLELQDRLVQGEKNIRNTKQCAKGSTIAKHAWTFDHTIDFNNAGIIDKGNCRFRKTLESWHTAKTAETVEADNNSCPLPGQCNILLNKH